MPSQRLTLILVLFLLRDMEQFNLSILREGQKDK